VNSSRNSKKFLAVRETGILWLAICGYVQLLASNFPLLHTLASFTLEVLKNPYNPVLGRRH
jgi:hypothetical protein